MTRGVDGAPDGANPSRHLVIVQHAGEHREAFHRLAGGGAETYHAQRHCVEAVGELRRRHPDRSVTVVTLVGPERHDERLPDGVRAVGLGLTHDAVEQDPVVQALADLRPTELVVRTANRRVLAWAADRGLDTLALLAESLATHSWRARWRAWRVARLLARPPVMLVAAYGRTSARAYARLGVPAHRIVPWDFLLEHTPVEPPRPRDGATAFRVCFAGALDPAKGVDDLIEAHARLRADGRPTRLVLIGAGDQARYERQVRALGLADTVEFAGRIPVADLESRMAEADVVVVPSRPDYPEGFPLVIHHALRRSVPVVASDHPMFLDVLVHERNALVFRAGRPDDLAACLRRLRDDPALQARLSAAAGPTWQDLRLPLKWGDVLLAWGDRDDGGLDALRRHALAPDPADPAARAATVGG